MVLILGNRDDSYFRPNKLRLVEEKFEDNIIFGTHQNKFIQKGKIFKTVHCRAGEYSIIINNQLQYDIQLKKDEEVNLKVYPTTTHPEIFGTWEVKKWYGKFEVYFNGGDLEDNASGKLRWDDGCNRCGTYDFILVGKNKMKLIYRMFVKRFVEKVEKVAPQGADLREWRY